MVEDRLAKAIVETCLRRLGQAIHENISVGFVPGGASSLLGMHLPSQVLTGTNEVLFLADGDQKPVNDRDSMNYEQLPTEELDKVCLDILGTNCNIIVDSGSKEAQSKQRKKILVDILKFCDTNLKYLQGQTPESFIWENMNYDNDQINSIEENLDYKIRFEKLTKIELGRMPYEDVTADEIFSTQVRCLATVNEESLRETMDILYEFSR